MNGKSWKVDMRTWTGERSCAQSKKCHRRTDDFGTRRAELSVPKRVYISRTLGCQFQKRFQGIMTIESVWCPSRLIFREIEDGRPGRRRPSGKQRGSGGARAFNYNMCSHFLTSFTFLKMSAHFVKMCLHVVHVLLYCFTCSIYAFRVAYMIYMCSPYFYIERPP